MLLVLNAGSSSIKFALFDAGLTRRMSGAVSEIGGASVLRIGDVALPCAAPDHQAAIARVTEALAARGSDVTRLSAAAHRVVHGGAGLTAACRITDRVEAQIAACIPLAPLHNPHNLAGIRALRDAAPDLPQFASFDTAFHATNPDVATRYAIPADDAARGLRRYGFHGISYASLVENLPALTGQPLPRRLLALHLGNGASLCAIREGQSVATTMGYSPLSGLTMGTRSGDIDGNAVLRLAELHGIDGAGDILNRRSGLLALGAASDMRALHASQTPEARLALDHFAYWAVRHAGSMIAAMGGLDALAFTGGIGENDATMRAAIMHGLGFTGLRFDKGANARNAVTLHEMGAPVSAWIIPAAEERHIAIEALRLIGPAQ